MNTKENLAYALAQDCYDKEYFERVILPVANQFSNDCHFIAPKYSQESPLNCLHCGIEADYPVRSCKNYDSEAYIVALLRDLKPLPFTMEVFAGLFNDEIFNSLISLYHQEEELIDDETAKRVKLADLRHRIALEPENAEQYNEAIAVLEGAE